MVNHFCLDRLMTVSRPSGLSHRHVVRFPLHQVLFVLWVQILHGAALCVIYTLSCLDSVFLCRLMYVCKVPYDPGRRDVKFHCSSKWEKVYKTMTRLPKNINKIYTVYVIRAVITSLLTRHSLKWVQQLSVYIGYQKYMSKI